jgi:hypothetical protein
VSLYGTDGAQFFPEFDSGSLARIGGDQRMDFTEDTEELGIDALHEIRNDSLKGL